MDGALTILENIHIVQNIPDQRLYLIYTMSILYT